MFPYSSQTIVYFADINLYSVVIFYTHCTIPQIYIDLLTIISALLTDSMFYNSSLYFMIVVQLELYILVLRFLLHHYKAHKNSVDRKFKQHA